MQKGSRLRKRCRFSAPFSSLIFDLEKRRVGDSRLETNDFSRYILEFFVLNFIFAIRSDNSDNSLFEKLILDLWRYILEFFVLNFIFAIRSDNSLFEKLILDLWRYIFEFLIIELSDNSLYLKNWFLISRDISLNLYIWKVDYEFLELYIWIYIFEKLILGF